MGGAGAVGFGDVISDGAERSWRDQPVQVRASLLETLFVAVQESPCGTTRRFTAVQQYGRYLRVEQTSLAHSASRAPTRDKEQMPLLIKTIPYIILARPLKWGAFSMCELC